MKDCGLLPFSDKPFITSLHGDYSNHVDECRPSKTFKSEGLFIPTKGKNIRETLNVEPKSDFCLLVNEA